jgi:hypothetical protein
MRIARYAGTLGIAAIVAAAVVAQTCPTGSVVLTVTPNATNTQLAVSVTGTAGAGVLLFQGPHTGQSTLGGNGPLANTVICLGTPFFPFPIGHIPAGGTLTLNLPAPPIPPGATVNFQAVTIALSGTPSPGSPPPTATVDTSNTASFTRPAPPPPGPCTPGSVVLNITPDTQVTPGSTITMSVTGTPGAFVMLAASHALGSTSFPHLPNPLCLAMPLASLPFGVIPTGGTLTHSHTVPATATLPGNVTIYFQAITVVWTAGTTMPTLDTSNTDFLML